MQNEFSNDSDPNDKSSADYASRDDRSFNTKDDPDAILNYFPNLERQEPQPQSDDYRSFVPEKAPPSRRVQVPLKLPDTPPTFTYILLGMIVAIYLIGQVIPLSQPTIAAGYWVTTTEEWLFAQFYKDNTMIIQQGQYYRLLTAMFLHGSLMHLFFNGYALYVIGRGIERLYGHGRFLLVYFLGGLTGSVASLLLSPNPSLGASGAIFAIFGAEAVFFFQHRDLFGQMARSRLQNMAFLIVINLAIGLAPGSNIDNWGHIGGFIGGVALAWFIGPKFKPIPPTPEQPYVALDDTNPIKARLAVPLVYAGVLVLLVGVAVLMGG